MMSLTTALPFLLLCSLSVGHALRFRDTGGTIVFEEAWSTPELVTSSAPPAQGTPEFIIYHCDDALTIKFNLCLPLKGGTSSQLTNNLLDVHNQRLQSMDANGIDFMVLSCAQPCIQGISDPVTAESMAIQVNNQLAATISNATDRFGGFAALAMHNATAAALELNRTVQELGFLGACLSPIKTTEKMRLNGVFQGALVNDYQQSGADGQTLLYYDQPAYDVFWQMVSDLDVPVYFHPRTNIQTILNLTFEHAPALIGPAQEFAVGLSTHILGLCTNGVFDRFPNLKIIVGHMGERIPSDLVRIDTQLKRQVANGLAMKLNVTTYWHQNIFETTSGNFAPDLLNFHIDQIGLDRIMYSIDYPFVNIPDGTAFINALANTMTPEDHNSLARGLAIKILHLDD